MGFDIIGYKLIWYDPSLINNYKYDILYFSVMVTLL